MKTIRLLSRIAWLLPVAAVAASRSSQNYHIPTDTIDAGGSHVSSAAYAMEASFGGLGTSANVGVLAHASYPGQLVEATHLAVLAPGTNLNEGSSLLLSAVVRYDDGTYADVTPGTRWSAILPLLASPFTPGLVSADAVFQNTVGYAQASYLGSQASLGVLVMNVQTDNYGSYAGDGLDDLWQVQHFGLSNPNAGPGRDPDGDGQSNSHEFMAGTSPTDGESRFRLGIARLAGQPGWKAITFSPRLASRTYTVEYGTNLVTGGSIPLVGQPLLDSGNVRTVTDQTATNQARFYRVRINLP